MAREVRGSCGAFRGQTRHHPLIPAVALRAGARPEAVKIIAKRGSYDDTDADYCVKVIGRETQTGEWSGHH